MACTPVNVVCYKNQYIKNSNNEDVLFSGIIVTDGNAITQISAPYTATVSNGKAILVGYNKVTYTIVLANTKYSLSRLKSLISDCNCCAEASTAVTLPAVTDMYNSDVEASIGGIALLGLYWTGTAHVEGLVHGALKLRTV